MNTPTKDIQIIKKDGIPIFVLMPYEQYIKSFPKKDRDLLPHEVVELVIKKEFNRGCSKFCVSKQKLI